jgi:hypothetical protein
MLLGGEYKSTDDYEKKKITLSQSSLAINISNFLKMKRKMWFSNSENTTVYFLVTRDRGLSRI